MYEFLIWLASFFAAATPATDYGAVNAPKTDYIGVVAAEAAYAAALPGSAPVKPKPPIDPDCKTCKGKGKIPSGDGLGWSPCPTCQAEDAAPAAPGEAQIQKPTRLPYQAQ